MKCSLHKTTTQSFYFFDKSLRKVQFNGILLKAKDASEQVLLHRSSNPFPSCKISQCQSLIGSNEKSCKFSRCQKLLGYNVSVKLNRSFHTARSTNIRFPQETSNLENVEIENIEIEPDGDKKVHTGKADADDENDNVVTENPVADEPLIYELSTEFDKNKERKAGFEKRIDKGLEDGSSSRKPEREFLDYGKRVRMVNLEKEKLVTKDFTVICDVRSPSEFEEDHIVGAINCPVLTNDERAEVGTLYKQVSPFIARRLGAALVANNVGKIMKEHFLELEKDATILVYCWRGGERSSSLAMVLGRVGWPVSTIQGGYKAYRAQVRKFMEEEMKEFRLLVVSGRTGSGKGLLLEALSKQGGQVIDLEVAANHRGSVLGDLPNQPQPSQKLFESRIGAALQKFSKSRPVFVEGESSMLGKLKLPKRLVESMRFAPQVEVHVPMVARVKHIREGYRHFSSSEGQKILESKLNVVRHIRGHKVVDKWIEMLGRNDVDTFIEAILVDHYDPSYELAMQRDRGKTLQGRNASQDMGNGDLNNNTSKDMGTMDLNNSMDGKLHLDDRNQDGNSDTTKRRYRRREKATRTLGKREIGETTLLELADLEEETLTCAAKRILACHDPHYM